LFNLLKLRSKIGIGKEIKNFWDSLGPMAKLIKTPKKGLFYEFRYLNTYHWNGLGIGVRVFVSLLEV